MPSRVGHFFPRFECVQMLAVHTRNIRYKPVRKAGSLQKVTFPLAKEIFLIDSCLKAITSITLLKVATK